MSGRGRQEFERNPVVFLKDALKSYTASAPGNRIPAFPDEVMFDDPLLGFASGDDYLFREYKLIIGQYHLTPREIMERSCKLPESAPLSVISIILPISLKTRLFNRQQKLITGVRWNHTTWHGQQFVNELSGYTVSLLRSQGYRAVAPELEKYYTAIETPEGTSINFSHRHAAYVAGLGTFGLHDNFITRKGAAMRCGTVITDATLPPSPRPYGDHYCACLFFRDGSCRACIKRCPASAITERGRDNEKCRLFRRTQAKMILALGESSGYRGPHWGCGLCQTKVPCEDRIPPSLKRRGT